MMMLCIGWTQQSSRQKKEETSEILKNFFKKQDKKHRKWIVVFFLTLHLTDFGLHSWLKDQVSYRPVPHILDSAPWWQ